VEAATPRSKGELQGNRARTYSRRMDEFPLPGMGRAVVAVRAPGDGPGYWAGASCAVLDTDGSFVVGYRVRNGHDGIDQTVIARSPDGVRFSTVATLEQSRFGAQWMERPAIVRTEQGRWRLYVCCGTPSTWPAPKTG
jgi:hypothetical protein